MKHKKTKYSLENVIIGKYNSEKFKINYRADFFDGEILDTNIDLVCKVVIAGSTIDNFIEDFKKLIDKYKT